MFINQFETFSPEFLFITKMTKKAAVMDLGTNTFHLLIAEGSGSSQQTLYRVTEPVKLGEGGINKGIIQPEPYKRGLIAMQQFQQKILEFDVKDVKAIATSALRNASNGKDFIADVMATTGIQIELINGNAEAEYIYHGVKAGNCLSAQNSLILDIGGGSVEFILANQDEVLWKESYEIGAARLMDKFHQIDPISKDCVAELHNYLEGHLSDLFTAVSSQQIHNIIGSSGAFETFARIIETDKGNFIDLKNIKTYDFDDVEFLNVTNYLIASSHQERVNNKAIIPIRVDMIVVAAILTRFIMDKLNIHTVGLSTNSLKEGVLAAMLAE